MSIEGWATIFVVSVCPFPGLEAGASPTAFAKLELGNEGEFVEFTVNVPLD
ncbi:MAG: hypothetical protein WD022_00875 [Balneolaceae bacterium]